MNPAREQHPGHARRHPHAACSTTVHDTPQTARQDSVPGGITAKLAIVCDDRADSFVEHDIALADEVCRKRIDADIRFL